MFQATTPSSTQTESLNHLPRPSTSQFSAVESEMPVPKLQMVIGHQQEAVEADQSTSRELIKVCQQELESDKY